MIGTIRVVPMQGGLTLTESLLAQANEFSHVLPEGSWEVGRLVVAPEYRSDAESLKRCLYLSLSYLCGHAEVQNLYASCSHVLSRLYRRFGFSALAREVLLNGTQKRYTLIHGRAPEVLDALTARPCGTSAQLKETH